MTAKKSEKTENGPRPRPPIIVVLGHVDHGKTKLLDYLRKTNLVDREAGGITQSIGAYEIIHNNKKITFIDTPGHEAFSKMRQRGAKVADLGILVVAADESVKQQTKEAIKNIKKENLPFVVAINKIDKPNADIERVKKDLAAADVLLEGDGGNISWQAISAKTGEGISDLLDLILLAAELENFTCNPGAEPAKGVIIEAKMDSRKGMIASAVLKDGTLKTGQEIATPSARGKIKLLENFLGEHPESLEPSAPALILGFEKLPEIGEEFVAAENLAAEETPAEKTSPQSIVNKEEALPVETESKSLKVVIKADNSGSLEALKDVILSLSSGNAKIEIADMGVGEINENDLKSAAAADALVIGFNVKSDKSAENLARTQDVKIVSSKIIYELVKTLTARLEELRPPKQGGELEVLALFGKPKGKRQIVGGRVLRGTVKNKDSFEIFREEKSLGFGRIVNLQQNKANAKEAEAGSEAGLLAECDVIIKVGDKLKF